MEQRGSTSGFGEKKKRGAVPPDKVASQNVQNAIRNVTQGERQRAQRNGAVNAAAQPSIQVSQGNRVVKVEPPEGDQDRPLSSTAARKEGPDRSSRARGTMPGDPWQTWLTTNGIWLTNLGNWLATVGARQLTGGAWETHRCHPRPIPLYGTGPSPAEAAPAPLVTPRAPVREPMKEPEEASAEEQMEEIAEPVFRVEEDVLKMWNDALDKLDRCIEQRGKDSPEVNVLCALIRNLAEKYCGPVGRGNSAPDKGDRKEPSHSSAMSVEGPSAVSDALTASSDASVESSAMTERPLSTSVDVEIGVAEPIFTEQAATTKVQMDSNEESQQHKGPITRSQKRKMDDIKKDEELERSEDIKKPKGSRRAKAKKLANMENQRGEADKKPDGDMVGHGANAECNDAINEDKKEMEESSQQACSSRAASKRPALKRKEKTEVNEESVEKEPSMPAEKRTRHRR